MVGLFEGRGCTANGFSVSAIVFNREKYKLCCFSYLDQGGYRI